MLDSFFQYIMIETKLVLNISINIVFQGEWLLFIVYLGKDYLRDFIDTADDTLNTTLHSGAGTALERLGFKDLYLYVIMAVSISLCTFWGIGLSFDTYFYRNRKHVVSHCTVVLLVYELGKPDVRSIKSAVLLLT